VDEVIAIGLERLDGADMLPVAALRRPVAWFEGRGIVFADDEDDLDRYRFAALRVRERGDLEGRNAAWAYEDTRRFELGEGVRPETRSTAMSLREAQARWPEADINFVLRRYSGSPPDTVDVLILQYPFASPLYPVKAVGRIAAALGVPREAILWPPDTPRDS